MERLTKLPWPDRLGLGIALLAAMGGLVVGLGLSTNGKADRFDWVLVPLVLTIAIGLPTWIVARVLDFVLGGPQRRSRT